MEKNYKIPAIVWLKVTDYMHGWLQHELGCEARVRNQRVVCVQHLPGAREILRMESAEDVIEPAKVGNAMSATRKNLIMAGLDIDEAFVMEEYGVSKEEMKLYVPIECPRMCLTKVGVLRPWTLDTSFGREQASAMQRLLRQAFWDAVTAFDRQYAERVGSEKYPAVDMIEAFCKETETFDMYVYAIRREWQRRVKREKEKAIV